MSLLAILIVMWLSFSGATSTLLSPIVPAPLRAHFAGGATTVPSPFIYSFNTNGILPESSDMNTSWSPYWWVNSGAYLILTNNVGMTVQGSLSLLDPWRLIYRLSNPVDTDNGTHPQNIFRLVLRSSWDSVRIEALFKIDRDNFSSSPNRNASNGLLLMSRYRDGGDTLYYAGVRVDGDAVIKKKYKGTYTTLAGKKLYPGTYTEGGSTNLIPHGAWIGLTSETVTNADGSVTIRLFVKNPGETSYTKILEARDANTPITGPGFLGIRTDFMDVAFENFRAEKL